MTDIVDQTTRSRMMSGIRSKDTKPELKLRKAMHALGLRYRLHGKVLSGRPDIVLSGRRAVIYVHGCFWHRHEGCRFTTTPTTRPDFWREKFAANMDRDRRHMEKLLADGWRVAVVWECALRRTGSPDAVARRIAVWLDGDTSRLEIGTERE